MMIAAHEKNGPGRPKAKALGYQPLVFAVLFAGRPKAKTLGYPALRSLPKEQTSDFFHSL
jgi:hypothetical protein